MKKLNFLLLVFLLNFSVLVLNSEAQWALQNSGVSKTLSSVHSISNNKCWVVGDSGTILRTNNGGNNWLQQSLGNDVYLYGVRFANAFYGWVVGDSGRIYRTINGGLTWIQQESGTKADLRSVFFVNAKTGWAVGDSGVILKTTNRGVNWFFQTSELKKKWYSVFFLNETTGWITGGATLKTTNGGTNWVTKKTSTNRRSIFFTDSNTGWVVGAAYTMDKSTDGGETWGSKMQIIADEEVDSPPAVFTSICFKDINTGWYTISHSFGGTIRMTTDNGVSWSTDYPTTWYRRLYGVFVLNSGVGWAVGESGTILKRSGLTGVSNESGEIPVSFSLSQNYPNPFNPTTKIKFNIAKLSDVKIVVYDVIGRQIQTLVNESLKPGKYEASFNGTSLNSGVYFYKISAGDYSEIRKMMLVK